MLTSQYTAPNPTNLRVHDSILNEVVKIIKEKYLIVDKPSRKTTILEIGFDHR